MYHGPTDTLFFMVISTQLIGFFVRGGFNKLFQLKNTEDRSFLILCFSLLTNRSYLVKNVQLKCLFCKSVQK